MYESAKQSPAGQVIETQRAIPNACERLEKAHHFLHDTINELANRLAPVLGPDRPTDAGNANEARQGLASTILREAATAEGASERIQELMRRLEI